MTEQQMTDDEVRAEVRGWLADNWDPDLDRAEWGRRVFEAGWAVPSWEPQWWGRGLSDSQSRLVAAEFAAVGARGSGADRSDLMATILHDLGNDEQRHRLIPPALRGETRWCLLYSEPGAGSDLAGLRTRADRDGDRHWAIEATGDRHWASEATGDRHWASEATGDRHWASEATGDRHWVINGQKVWTSFATKADYGLLIARTEWDVPKHKGIGFFIFPMRQPGVEIRPIHQITGESEFNEVFITDARVPNANLVGEPGDGWAVLQVALAYERRLMGDLARTAKSSRDLKPDADSLIGMARAAGLLTDSALRQQIATVEGYTAVNRWNTQRAKATRDRTESATLLALGKIAMSRILHQTARVQTAIAGPESMLTGPDHPVGDAVTFRTLNAYFTSIGGGTDQIQRNIVGERVLGLPKEPEPFKDTAFRDLPSGG